MRSLTQGGDERGRKREEHIVKRHFWRINDLAAIAGSLVVACNAGFGAVILQDSLQGATIGQRVGGAFADGGWRVTSTRDFIYWHLPRAVSWGAVEFYVKGLESRDPDLPGDNDILEMYDYTNGADSDYNAYRNNPYKFRLLKN